MKKRNVTRSVKQASALMLASVLTISGIPFTGLQNAVQAAESGNLQAAYGLEDNVQDGLILHAWDWSFNNISAQMENIAKAGYTSIQTSPIQPYKQASESGNSSNSTWWLFYQPTDFKITQSKSQNLLGSETEFKAMCEKADEYGIKIIVDVVANHVAATRDGSKAGYDYSINDYLKNNNFYHNMYFPPINYGDRYSIINDSMGDAPNTLPDLNTENYELQNYVEAFLEDCIDDGADGFRFDAAKHIGVPADGSQYTFFSNVVNKAKAYYRTKGNTTADELYCYGEILDQPGGNTKASDYVSYVKVTDNGTSATIRNGVNGNAGSAATSYYQKNVTAKNVVLWPESHDEYQNENGATRWTSQSVINKAWAMDASRANATSLYYARTAGYHAGQIGEIGTYNWRDKEVVAANQFHNMFTGQTEYLSSENNIAYNERGTTGAVLVNCDTNGRNKEVNVTAHKLVNGSYKDMVTGNIFTVSNGRIAGQIGDTGIAIITTDVKKDVTGIALNKKEITLGLGKTTSLTASVLPADATNQNVTWTSSDLSVASVSNGKVTGKKEGTATITVTTEEGGFTANCEVRVEQTTEVVQRVYFKNTNHFATPTAYIWKSGSNSNTKVWPGEKMTKLDGYDDIYYVDVTLSDDFDSIIFSDNGGSQTKDLTISDKDTSLFNNGQWVDSTGLETNVPVNPIVTNKKIYFKNTSNWSTPTVYLWNNASQKNAKSWPGQAMSYDSTKGLWFVEVNVDFKDGYDRIIFSNNGANQTADLTIPSDRNDLYQDGAWIISTNGPVDPIETTKRIYLKNTSNWSTPTVYLWNNASQKNEKNWPGEAMNYDSSKGLWYFDVNVDATKGFDRIIFSNQGANQTRDLVIPTTSADTYELAGQSWN